jgi:conjugative element/phage-associated large polyvalent protein
VQTTPNPFDHALDELAREQRPTPSTAPSPFDRGLDELAQEQQEQQQQLRTRVQPGKTAPDAAAEIERLSIASGLPPAVVERNLDTVRRRVQLQQTPVEAMQQQTPALAGWLKDSPQRAAVAQDDLANLGTLEWLLTAPQRAFRRGQAVITVGELRSASLYRRLTADEERRLAEARTEMEKGGALGAGDSWFRGAVTGTAELLPNLWGGYLLGAQRGITYGVTAGTAAAIAGQVTPGLPEELVSAPAMFGYGMRAGMLQGSLEFGFQLEAGLAYDEFLGFRDELGRPIDPDVAKAAAFATGAINAIGEAYGLERLLKGLGVDRLTGVMTRRVVGEALKQPTVRAALAKAMKSYAGTLGAETATEVGQKLVTILAGELAKGTGQRADVPGLLEPGTVDLYQQPRVPNPDGSISTVDSISVNLEGREVLLPRVTPDGRHLTTPEEAVAEYQQTGRHLGIFDTPEHATTFATQVHEDYAAGTYDRPAFMRSLADVGSEVADETVGALQSFSILSLPGPVRTVARGVREAGAGGTTPPRPPVPPSEVRRARQAAHNVQFFTALGEAATAAKTLDRDPAGAEALLSTMTLGGPLTHFFAPIDTWTTYWQSKGEDPAHMAAQATGDPEAFFEAQRLGQDLPIPAPRYVTQLARTEHNAFFAQELRLGDGELNAREAAVVDKLIGEEATAAAAPVDDSFRDVLLRAGVPAHVADQYVPTVTAYHDTAAERAGAEVFTRTMAQWAPVELEGGSRSAGLMRFDPLTPTVAATPEAAAALPDLPASLAPAGESSTQRGTRRVAHLEALTKVLVDDARRTDPTVDPGVVQEELQWRLDMLEERQQLARESGRGQDLLRMIARYGGVWSEKNTGAYVDELALLLEERDKVDVRDRGTIHGRAKWNGVEGVVNEDGLTPDRMAESLRQDQRFEHILGPNELFEAISDAIRADPDPPDALPGTADLPALGITPGTAWWVSKVEADRAQPGAGDVDETTPEDGGDDSFEFSQPASAPLAYAPARYQNGRAILSTRVPSGKFATLRDDVLETRLAVLDEPEARDAKERFAGVARELPLLTTEEKRRLRRDPDATLERFVARAVSNLRWLWKQLGEEDRARARQWYVGAHRIAVAIADEHGMTDEQGAGVLASLSPQMDWFKNVALARRAAAAFHEAERTNPVFGEEFFFAYEGRTIASIGGSTRGNEAHVRADIAQTRRDYLGKSWRELDLRGQAILLREIDEARGVHDYPVITPEGGEAGLVLTADGKPAHLAWGTYRFIGNAISIMRDGAIENIHRRLGDEHKVRSFFNNISDPDYAGAVTIDVHAVAAAVLQPLSGNSKLTQDAIGGRPNALGAGLSGFNCVYAEAYFRLAEQLSRETGTTVLPREVQSVTWEAVRALFPPATRGTRSALGQNVNALWKLHQSGNLRADAVRTRIAAAVTESSGPVGRPAWADAPAGVVPDEGVLHPRDVRGRAAGVPARRGDTRRGAARASRQRAAQLDGVVRGVGTHGLTLEQSLPPRHQRAIELYRERVSAGSSSPVHMALALRDAGVPMPTQAASRDAKRDANALVDHLLQIADAREPQLEGFLGELSQEAAPATPEVRFFSRLERAVERTPQAKASGAQWKATIRNAKGGINLDEFAYVSVDDLEDGVTYTKQEVLDYLKTNRAHVAQVEMKERDETPQEEIDEKAEELYDREVERRVEEQENYGEGPDYSSLGEPEARFNEDEGKWEAFLVSTTFGQHEEWEDVGTFYDTLEDALEHAQTVRDAREAGVREDWLTDIRNEVDYGEMREAAEEYFSDQRGDEGGVQFAEWVLPGAEEGSYREVFVRAHDRPGRQFVSLTARENYALPTRIKREIVQSGDRGVNVIDAYLRDAPRRSDLTPDVVRALEKLRASGNLEYDTTTTWRDGHSEYDDIENPIVRLRTNVRETADGRSVLFLEEVQPPREEEFDKMPRLFQKNWREIGFKWALRECVNLRLDGVAWTTGETQLQRYDLAKAVERIDWVAQNMAVEGEAKPPLVLVEVQPKDLTGRGTNPIALWADPASGKVVQTEGGLHHTVGQPLADVVGEQLAARMFAEPDGGRVEGEGLRVGSVGLAKVYDADLPNVANKIVKRLGARATVDQVVTRKAGIPLPANLPADARPQWEAKHPPLLTTVDAHMVSLTPEQRARVGEEGIALYQAAGRGGGGRPPGRRGAINFGVLPDGRRLARIRLMRGADRSTFLHEMAHYFFEFQGDLVDNLRTLDPATLTDTQQRLLADWNTMLAYVGVTQRSEVGREQHEQFARSYEAWLMEGKAPSIALREAFANFTAWLKRIYRTLRALDVELSDDVRGVFDRMFATDDAIAAAREEAQITPLFTDAEHAGVSELEFASYVADIRAASQREQDLLRTRVLRDLKRADTDTWKEERDRVTAEVTAEVQAQPVYRAMSVMRTGSYPDGAPFREGEEPQPIKLSRASLIAQYGRDILAQLPRPYLYAVQTGISADTAAVLFGFDSGEALLRACIEAPPMRVVVDAEVERRMVERHGDLYREPDRLADEARRIVNGEQRARIVAAELKALTKGMVRQTIPSAAVINRQAERRINAMRIRDVRPGVYLQAAQRASKRAFDQLAAGGDRAGAVQSKLQELINLALYRHARDAKERVEAQRRRLQSYRSPAARQRFGKAGGHHLAQIDGFLDRYELARVPQRDLDRRTALSAYVERMTEERMPIDIPPSVLDDARRVNYQELTIEQFTDVHDAVEHIARIARLKHELLTAAKKRTFDEERDDLVASLYDNNEATPKPIEYRPSDEKWERWREWFASHSKIAMLARSMDGERDGGQMVESIIFRINAASDRKETMMAEAARRINAIFTRAYPGRELLTLNQKRHIPAIGNSLSKEGCLAIALNWGNEVNRERLLNDPSRRWNRAQVEAVLATLDERDWRFVQEVWDYTNEYWDEIAAKERRVKGIAPEKVEAAPFETRFGPMRGGYYTLKGDPRLGARAGVFAESNEATLKAQAAAVNATTRRGHLKARVEHAKYSVRLDLSVFFNHIDQVVHDLTHHEMLIDVNRLLEDRQVQDAILETRGHQVYTQFVRALEDVALGSAPAKNILERAANFGRTGTQIALLGFNFWTALQQPLGLWNGMERVGGKWVLRGMVRWLRDADSMQGSLAWVHAQSAFMRNRHLNATQDLADLRTALGRPGGWFDALVRTVTADTVTQQNILNAFTWHIGAAQKIADMPTWLGAYEKAMAEGNEETRAVALADQAVIDSQGSGSIKDLALIQRGTPTAKLFLTFYSYGNTVYNRTAANVYQLRRRGAGYLPEFLINLSYLYVLPALGTVALSRAFGRTGGDEDDTPWLVEFAKETLSGAFNTMALVRELGAAGQIAVGLDPGVRGYEGPAGLRPIQLLYRAAQQVGQGEVDQAAFNALLQTAGVLFRFPAAQVQRTIDGYAALEEGRTSNPGALLVGAPKE